ncbi:MAG: hypothetical protein OEW75_18040, partial [Cyclobacteriaceae bacterium]|nr:hypothetical protein [Cyclobacteriaceae bacterium]
MRNTKSLMKEVLVQRIESQIGWGSGKNWSNKEFEELSEQIFIKTRKQVSVTTLKRLWGRAEQIANPSVSTLDILAEFAAYKSWRHFLEGNKSFPAKKSNVINFKRGKSAWSIVVVILLLGVGVIWFGFSDKKPDRQSSAKDIVTDSIYFSLQKVTNGYPNTVIFTYDIGKNTYDSLFIQQDWDIRKRIPLNEAQGLVTSTYYYPGYYLTKLVVNDKIVKEENLYIPTSGWEAYIPQSWNEVTYLNQTQVLLDSTLKLSPEVLDQINDDSLKFMSLTNLSKKPQINSSNFNLETEFRLEEPSKKSICRFVSLTVTGTKDVMSIQFSIPGCVGDLMLYINREMVSGRNHDLSAFGLNMEEWINCKIEVKDNQLAIFINDKPIHNQQLTKDLGQIGGVQWTFEGLGEIGLMQIEDKDSKIDFLSE